MKYFSALFQVLLFGLAVTLSFYSLRPSETSKGKTTDFSVDRAMLHVEELAKEPHYTGSVAHAEARNYIVSSLENLGLEPHLQHGFSTTYFKGLSIAVPENIIAKIKGKNPEEPALLIMSHYDSAVHSAYGAADAASGVAAILESIRAFLAQDKQPEQDVIILFTDTEEVGLNGANLFVKEHPWAENIGLVLNFEARGSAGASPMILEVNGGNKHLISHFAKAKVSNPFANSFMYSVYKLLPNNTDSTIFRKEKNIPGYFFAFIDDHFNYHTALDTTENLDSKSLNQQGEYALSLLNYFSSTSLTNLASPTDHVYFNFPFVGLIHFSFSTALFLIVFSFFGLFLLLYIGIKKDKIQLNKFGRSFLFALSSLLLAFLIGFFGWKFISYLYPEYKLILHGFPYNGHAYILAFVFLILASYFRAFYNYSKKVNLTNHMPVVIFIWLIISLLAYVYLPGASYFVLPALFGLFIFALLVLTESHFKLLFFLLSMPVVFLIVPFLYFFPVGLGISSIYISCVLGVLILLIISPLIYDFKLLKGVSFLLFCTSIFFFGKAHINADFNSTQPRPSSLVYYQDMDVNKSFWASYDTTLSNWNTTYFENALDPLSKIDFENKYGRRFSNTASAKAIQISPSKVEVHEVSSNKNQRTYKLFLTPERVVNRYEAFFDRPITYTDIKVNGKPVHLNLKEREQNKNTRFFNYYVTNQEALEIEFTVETPEAFQLKVYESAFNLIEHPELKVQKRSNLEIPMPFVLNDATIVAYSISFL